MKAVDEFRARLVDAQKALSDLKTIAGRLDDGEAQPAPQTVLATADEGDGAFLQRIGTDAKKWSIEFMERFFNSPTTIDQSDLIGWFANAIEAGRTAGYAKGQADLSSAVADRTALLDFFRSPEGLGMGQDGDDHGWSTGETAVKMMRELLRRRDDSMQSNDASALLQWLNEHNIKYAPVYGGGIQQTIIDMLNELLKRRAVMAPKPPIPSGIYYSAVANDFYDQNNHGQGKAFFDIWCERSAEFPQSLTELSKPGPITAHHDIPKVDTVEFLMGDTGKVWLNINGRCIVRIGEASSVTVNKSGNSAVWRERRPGVDPRWENSVTSQSQGWPFEVISLKRADKVHVVIDEVNGLFQVSVNDQGAMIVSAVDRITSEIRHYYRADTIEHFNVQNVRPAPPSK